MFRLPSLLRPGSVIAALLAGISAAPAALADTISYVSEPGDWIGQGQTLSLSQGLNVYSNSDRNFIYAYVTDGTAPGGHNVVLTLLAPTGQQLQPGVYASVSETPDASHGGLSFYGDGRACSGLTGTFTITALTFGPYGYVQKLEAYWEQKCAFSTGSLFGQISINRPEPPPPLVFTSSTDSEGAINKKANLVTVGGSVSCSFGDSADITGAIIQARGSSENIARADFQIKVPCAPTESHWSVTLSSNGNVPFSPGLARYVVHAWAYDPPYYMPRGEEIDTVIHLNASKQGLVTEKGQRFHPQARSSRD
jgi:hypothetical protein